MSNAIVAMSWRRFYARRSALQRAVAGDFRVRASAAAASRDAAIHQEPASTRPAVGGGATALAKQLPPPPPWSTNVNDAGRTAAWPEVGSAAITETTPPACAGTSTSSVCASTNVTCTAATPPAPVAGSAPNSTCVDGVKPSPWRVASVPPSELAVAGSIESTLGSTLGAYENAAVAMAPPGFSTSTRYGPPGTPGSVVISSSDGLTTLTPGWSTPSMRTVEPATKPLPVSVTSVPPSIEPPVGNNESIAGTERKSKPATSRPSTPVESIATTSYAPPAVGTVVSVTVSSLTTVQPPGAPSS